MRPSAGSFDEAITTVENLSGWKSLLRLFGSVRWQDLEQNVWKQESSMTACPISVLTQDMFKRFDKKRIRVVCFLLQSSNVQTLHHQWQRDMLLSFGTDNVVSLQGMTSEAAAFAIAAHRVGVLVDMNGLSLHSGLLIMGHRPAPVQMSFLGDPYTSGVAFVDYFVSDALATPPDFTADHFTEKLLLLSACYLVNSHAAWLPQVPLSPRHSKTELIAQVHDSAQYLDLDGPRHFDPSSSVLLGAFHGFVKIDPSVVHVWTNVLRRCGGQQQCYLAMNNNKASDSMRNLQRITEYHGVRSHNLLFLNQSAWDEHVTRKGALDLFLDTSLKNGHTTTVDALYAGLPVVGLRGMDSAHQRSTESLTHFTGSDAGMTSSMKQYEDRVVELTATVRGRRRLAAWRGHSEVMRRESSLFDTQHFVDKFADLLQVTVDLRYISELISIGESTCAEGRVKCERPNKKFHVFASNVRG
eukprot:gene25247-31680_t